MAAPACPCGEIHPTCSLCGDRLDYRPSPAGIVGIGPHALRKHFCSPEDAERLLECACGVVVWSRGGDKTELTGEPHCHAPKAPEQPAAPEPAIAAVSVQQIHMAVPPPPIELFSARHTISTAAGLFD